MTVDRLAESPWNGWPNGVEYAKMAISSQKPCQVFFAELGKLFFGADLLEGPGMSAGSLLGLKLTSLRSQ
jgi:hypothetical protein